MQHRFTGALALVVAVLVSLTVRAQEPVSLTGKWRFELDRQDVGITQKWFERALPERITLPGALQNEGFGDDISADTKWTASLDDAWLRDPKTARWRQPGNFKQPFWLQPLKHYVGVAWYQRDIEIPEAFAGRRVLLTLERAHWETQVWLDGRFVGSNDSLSVAHVYELGVDLPAGKHTLTIRVDNHLIVNVGSWAHSVSDHTQGNWNGIVGRIDLSAASPVYIDDAQVYPDLQRKSALVKVKIGNATGKPGRGRLSVGGQGLDVAWTESGGRAEVEVSLGADAKAWDEFSPVLQKLPIRLTGDGVDDSRIVTFGLRQLTTEGTRFLLNGRPTFFRGTLECCIFPLTGYPPTDIDSWKRIIRICQAHGLNHMRFHSWCPPEAAFEAADELGFYYQVEIAAWTEVGSGKPVDAWLYKEAGRILKAYGNHPSFMLMPYGNEPSGAKSDQYLAKWVTHWRQTDPRRLYTSASGWPQLPENQYHVTPAPRGPRGWEKDYIAQLARFRVPVIVHEIGQYCVYPNFAEMKKYTGPLKPRNFEIFKETLAENGMADQAHDFLMASGKLQVLAYKEEIEAMLRTPGLGGFQLLDLHDFPGQGTALVGVLDPFWDSKPYCTPAEYRRFCNATVPLARLPKRVWLGDETLTGDVTIAHYGPAPLKGAVVTWQLLDEHEAAVASGELAPKDVPLGTGNEIGHLSIDLSKLAAPARYRLALAIRGTAFADDWNIFVYPRTLPAEPAGVRVTGDLDDATLAALNAGGRVALLLNPNRLSRDFPRGSFDPIFWNKAMFKTQPRSTLGILCDPKHPALAAFPTEFFTDFQWKDILTQSRCMVMDSLPKGLRPIVQPIDDWNTNRRLGLVFECRVGSGRLLVCSADLSTRLETRPAARQLRSSLLAYAASDAFTPEVAVDGAALQGLLSSKVKSRLLEVGARIISCDSQEPGFEAAQALDGEPQTMWHTAWTPTPRPMPHELVIDLGKEMTVSAVRTLPRQDGNSNGRIGDYAIYCSADGRSWGDAVAQGKWQSSETWQQAVLKTPVRGRFILLAVKSEVRGQPFASLAEIDADVKP